MVLGVRNVASFNLYLNSTTNCTYYTYWRKRTILYIFIKRAYSVVYSSTLKYETQWNILNSVEVNEIYFLKRKTE